MAQITLGIGNMAPSKLAHGRKREACHANKSTQSETEQVGFWGVKTVSASHNMTAEPAEPI